MLDIKKRLKLGLIAVCAIGFLAGCDKDPYAYLNEREFTAEDFKNKEFLNKVGTDCYTAGQEGYAFKDILGLKY